MNIDLQNLTQTQLLRIVNSTPAGTVLTRSMLRKQMDSAALTFGDGKHIHLLRYIRYLVELHHQHRTSAAGAEKYLRARQRQSQRNLAATRAAQNIAPIPDVADAARRRAACKSLKKFCRTYFQQEFFWGFSDDHKKVISILEQTIVAGGLFAFAMPRGSGKTTLLRTAALWAILTGRCQFVCLIGASRERAAELLASIKMHILENERLRADFPEAVYPLWRLENTSKRQKAQHCNGKLTHVHWGDFKVVFPTIARDDLPASLLKCNLTPAATGAVITATSLDSNLRGQQHTRPDGTTVRPSLILLDDPQTRQSASSPRQTKFRLELLNGDVLALAGPGARAAVFMACTKIYAGDLADQILDKSKHPEWRGECMKMLYSLPENLKLWDEYDAIRRDRLRRGLKSRPETAFYRRHRKQMDAGAIVAWRQRYIRGEEISAVQHAMNLLYRDRESFYSEYQNEPIAEQPPEEDLVSVQQVIEKVSGRPRKAIPPAVRCITAGIDVHDRLLYYCLVAWEENFTGHVIDYGTYPAQRRSFFTLRDAPLPLSAKYPGRSIDAVILTGLTDLVRQLTSEVFQGASSGVMRVSRIFVDAGYKPEIVEAVIHRIGGNTVTASRGVGISARMKPFSQYTRRPGERYGHHWRMPLVRSTREFAHVEIDVNYWKSYVHQAFATPLGEAGSLCLYGTERTNHELFAEHIAGSEFRVETSGRGRRVFEWSQKPNRPDNHFFDCLVMAAAAASFEGIATEAMVQSRSRRKRYTQRDLQIRG